MSASEKQPALPSRQELAEVLQAFVSREEGRRRGALAALSEVQEQLMYWGGPDQPDSFDDDFRRPFEAAIREAVASAAIDTPRWLGELVDAYERAGEWRFRRDDSYLCPEWVMAGSIIPAVEDEWLKAPDALRRLLRDSMSESVALHTLERIGPPAVGFADELAEELLAPGLNIHPRSARSRGIADAMAAIIRESPPYIRRVLGWLDSEDSHTRSAGLLTLAEIGAAAREHCRDLPGRFMKMVGQADRADLAERMEGLLAIYALGFVTRGSGVAVDKLLALSRSADAWIAGEAITALGATRAEPERVIPRLVEALEDYREPDPDMTFESEHQRVADALKEYGPAAAPAVPAIRRHMLRSDEPGVIDDELIGVLRNIGPAAREALPALEQLAHELDYSEHDLEDSADVNELARTILYLRNL